MNMQEQPKELTEKQQDVHGLKSPYKTPRLERLGNVKELTEGVPMIPRSDDGGASL